MPKRTDSRDRMIVAARRLFREHGYLGAALSDVVTETTPTELTASFGRGQRVNQNTHRKGQHPMTVTAEDLRANVIGTWTLESYESRSLGGSSVIYPLGPRPARFDILERVAALEGFTDPDAATGAEGVR